MADYNNNSRRFGGKGGSGRGGNFGGGRGYGEKSFERKPFGEKKPYEGKPRFDGERGARSYEGKPRFDGERRFDAKPRFEGKPFGERKFDGKPRFDGERGGRSYGDKPRFEGRPRFDGEHGGRGYGDKPRFDGERGGRGYGDKPRFEGKPRFDGERGGRGYGDKPRFEGKPRFDGERGGRGYGDKPRFDGERRFEGKPRFDERPRFERPEFVQETPIEPENLPNIIMGRNPVREAVKSGRSIDRILVTAEHDGSLGEIVAMAREKNLVIREVDRRRLDEICMPFGHDGKPGNHQGIVAEIPGVEYSELSDILAYAEEKGEKPFVILLDGIEDPHNLGSIIRSAECAGAHGVVIPKRRSAPVTATVVKTSAGAAEHMRIARVVNIVSAMEQLKEAGLWIAGADMAGDSMYKTDMKGGFALVIGGEGDGLGKLVKEKCDFLVSIPIKGSIDSLNAAVAAAIIMFEKNRQDAQ